MSADLLRRAADLISARGVDAADSAPWNSAIYAITGVDGEVIARTVRGRAPALWEADWIALMHPGIAAPLAAWLRAEADEIDRREQLDLVGGVAVGARAVEVARALLGETGET